MHYSCAMTSRATPAGSDGASEGLYRGADLCIAQIGEKWSLLIVREVLAGNTKFSEIRAALGLSHDVLSDRLQTLVQRLILRRESYREPGSRVRERYLPTEAAEALVPVLRAMDEWGRRYGAEGRRKAARS
ncbi:DNA-binding transcriptional regulator, HxlR family [Amycolatopsis sacchari]|uniref:DNA-binding transcriptional regulator, HxlR family n=2 Tax=Amycolatopsis TaxID=1813 RepID=A0A1I3XG78_9PSEU|nr:DNA-binding transcriptional regulator, HxlR family [Amycolatopsis sacchari]